MSLIEVNNVYFRYNEQDQPAVKNINLAIEAGEFVSIIGANGSGKSTLAKLLNVLLLPDRGTIYVNGFDTGDPEYRRDIRKNIGMVFQNPDNQLIATMVEDDVAFGPENLGIPGPEIRQRVDRALEMVGMEGYQRYSPHNLSGGQKQRVAIAGIIAMQPACLILDEPTAMLDPRGREEVMDTISYLNREKEITIIHITHFMGEAGLADRVLIMDEGSVIKEGQPLKVFNDAAALRNINLDVPVALELAEGLRQEGCPVPELLTGRELVDYLC